MAAEVEADLRAAGLVTERCGDVYRGLARVKPDGADVSQVLVVGVDRLGPAQMEFFQHAVRLLPSVPVFVYGTAQHEHKLEQALQLGATARLTEEVLQELAQPAPAEADVDLPTSSPTAVAEVPAVADEIVGGVLEETPTAPGTTPAPAVDEPEVMRESEVWDESSDGDESEQRAESEEDVPDAPEPSPAEETPASRPRVPWIRDADRPVRRPPPARAAPDRAEQEPANEREAQPEPAPASSEREYSDEPPIPEQEPEDGKYAPLLSADEWQALMGDDEDISAIAPPDPEQEGAGS